MIIYIYQTTSDQMKPGPRSYPTVSALKKVSLCQFLTITRSVSEQCADWNTAQTLISLLLHTRL